MSFHKKHKKKNSANSPSNKLKNEQVLIRHEKSKSNIQTIMGQIYQEEEKNSKIVKYLTQANDFRISSPKSNCRRSMKIRSPAQSIKSPLLSNFSLPGLSPKISIKTINSLEFTHESPRMRPKKFDLEIEDPNIINLYHSTAGNSIRKSKSTIVNNLFMASCNFDDHLKRKKTELNKYLVANTDFMAKMKQKQNENEQSNIFNVGEKKKKHLNVKEESIKRRFIKAWNMKRIEKQEAFNEEIEKKLEMLETCDSPRKSSSLLNKKLQTHENIISRKKNPTDIKSLLKKLIVENDEKPGKKLTTIDKIKEKYEYSKTNKKKHDLELLESRQRSPMNSKKSTIEKIEMAPKNDIFLKEMSKESVISNLSNMKSPQQKFDVFYSDLMDYYLAEMKDKWDVKKEISHQVVVYDDELRTIKERLFEFNANLDKEFGKEVVEGGLGKFSSIRRTKRRR